MARVFDAVTGKICRKDVRKKMRNRLSFVQEIVHGKLDSRIAVGVIVHHLCLQNNNGTSGEETAPSVPMERDTCKKESTVSIPSVTSPNAAYC